MCAPTASVRSCQQRLYQSVQLLTLCRQSAAWSGGAEQVTVDSLALPGEHAGRWQEAVVRRLVDELGLSKLMFEAPDPEVGRCSAHVDVYAECSDLETPLVRPLRKPYAAVAGLCMVCGQDRARGALHSHSRKH